MVRTANPIANILLNFMTNNNVLECYNYID